VTTAVGAEKAVADPSAFVAVTATRTVEPWSALDSRYVPDVAPGIAAQLVPEAEQRCHWKAKADGLPVQPPVVAESDWPTCGVPVTTGGEVDVGAPVAATPAVTIDVAVVEPAPFRPVTATRIVAPASAAASV